MENPAPTVPMTPMLTQYWEIKRKYPDAIVFYRMGDFYEMFFDDALTAAPVLEVQLTSRDKSATNPIPMCGIPYHAVTQYLQKLLAKGYKVAICEQMEDPALTKGIVRRDVTRVVTPALIGDPDLVPEETSNWLACLWQDEKKTGQFVVKMALLDLLGGQIREGEVQSLDEIREIFSLTAPKELLLPESLKGMAWLNELKPFFTGAVLTYRSSYFVCGEKESPCLTAMTRYLGETQKLDKLPYGGSPLPLSMAQGLQLDNTTASSLEITRSANLQGGTTLFDILNYTRTPMGRRLLKDWLLCPLSDARAIEQRLDAVENLLHDTSLATELGEVLAQIRDLERLTTKAALGLAMPRDLASVRAILKLTPELKRILQKSDAKLLRDRGKKLKALEELTALLEAALEDQPPATLRDGGIFRDTYHPEVQECRSLSRDAKSTIASIEARENQRTGIPELTIKYSKVFGYTIEITRAYLNRVPSEYHRKQTIANGERYITEELKTFEEKAITAEHRLKVLEEGLFIELRQKVGAEANALLANARLIAEIDVLGSFARAARERGYARPTLSADDELNLEDSRHPVIETLLPPGQFVPNSVHLSREEGRTIIITGPNMGGKSTIMRQVALIVLMAHAGSYVPAREAVIPLTDAIFTRIGSSDDLTRGRSTFMVEMTEVARILGRATERSLIIIDEIGRGTSTYDGLSLAWSLLEYIHTSLKSFTLFATHFHELTHLEKSLPGLRNANVLVQKWKEDIVFLYKLAPGICNQSYGIEVAKLAGLPTPVLSRARHILGLLESQSERGSRIRNRALEIHDNQLAFFEEQNPPETRAELEN
jgi:DNA mismatch repair protein MutS